MTLPSGASATAVVPYPQAIAGATGGAATVLILHPLDTLKTKLQSAGETRSARGLLFSLLRSGPSNPGLLRTLYAGAFPALVGSASSWGIYLQAFSALRKTLPFASSFLPHGARRDFTAGALAGLLTSALTNPVWLAKTRLQLQSASAANGGEYSPRQRYRGLSHALIQILKEDGLRGWYRGFGASAMLASHGAIQFSFYERVKAILGSGGSTKGVPASHALVAATVSKLAASVITYPLQVIRTRMQERGAIAPYRKLWVAVKHIVATEGVRGLYRGLFANVLRVAPHSAITLVTYETVLRLIGSE